ncbi:MAG: serine/threonine-protein kinase PknK [Myxococcota bacterium]
MSGSEVPGTPRQGGRLPAGQSGETATSPEWQLDAPSLAGQRDNKTRPSIPVIQHASQSPESDLDEEDASAATLVSKPAHEATLHQVQAPLAELMTRIPLEPAGKVPPDLSLRVPPQPALPDQPTVLRNGEIERPTFTPELHELHWNTASVSLPLPSPAPDGVSRDHAAPNNSSTTGAISSNVVKSAQTLAAAPTVQAVSLFGDGGAQLGVTPISSFSQQFQRASGFADDVGARYAPARPESRVQGRAGQIPLPTASGQSSTPASTSGLSSQGGGAISGTNLKASGMSSPLESRAEPQKQTRIAQLDSLYEPGPTPSLRSAGGHGRTTDPRMGGAEKRLEEPPVRQEVSVRAATPTNAAASAPDTAASSSQRSESRSETEPLQNIKNVSGMSSAGGVLPSAGAPLRSSGGVAEAGAAANAAVGKSATVVKAPTAAIPASASAGVPASGAVPGSAASVVLGASSAATAPAPSAGGGVEQLNPPVVPTEVQRLEPGVFLKDYELLEQVGEGGMAVIYKARHVRTGAFVAVKALHAHQQTVLAGRRFDREFRAIQSIEHEHIVRVMDQGKFNEQAYIIMEFVEGHDLKAHMKVLKVLPPEQRWREIERIVMQLCDALDRIHKCNLIHRDLKPSNILLTSTHQVKLTDFGVAKPLDPGNEQLTSPGMLVGTLAYLAPEVFEQGTQTPRLDLYALGVMLYVLLTEKLPFAGKNIVQIMQKHLKHVPEVPQVVNPDVPSYLSELTMKLLAKKQEERPQNALEVIRAIVVGRGDYQVEQHEPQVFGDVWVPRFVGRTAELRQLHDAIYRLSTGTTGELVLVEGMEGSGRSRMIEQGLMYARQLGLPIYTGRCVPGGQGWGEGFRNIMREVHAEVGRSAFDQFPRSRLQAILNVNDRGEQPNPVTTPTSPPLQDFEGEIMTVLRALLLKSKTPRILWIQQLEYADQGTLLALKDAVRQLCRGFHLLVVASCRPLAPASGLLYETFCQGSLVSWVKRIPLPPLQQDELGQLVGALLGGDPRSLQVAQRLALSSGGSPMLAVEQLRLLMERRLLVRFENQQRWKLMSRNTDDALLAELDVHLRRQVPLPQVLLDRILADTSSAKQLLYLLAVWGHELRPSTLARFMSTTEEHLMPHVRYLRRMGWVVDTWVGGVEAWQLAHPYYRAFLLHVLRRDENKKILQRLEYLAAQNRTPQQS